MYTTSSSTGGLACVRISPASSRRSRRSSSLDGVVHLGGTDGGHGPEEAAVDRRAHLQLAAGEVVLGEPGSRQHPVVLEHQSTSAW
jgi:hypothetical protein